MKAALKAPFDIDNVARWCKSCVGVDVDIDVDVDVDVDVAVDVRRVYLFYK